jgi:hypothetical protein
MYLTGVHLIGVHLTGVHFTGVYLMGVHLIVTNELHIVSKLCGDWQVLYRWQAVKTFYAFHFLSS